MTLETVLFWIFGGLAVAGAIATITRKNPVISALFLIMNFGGLAGLYLLLHAQFIAVVQIIVYAGAIMVLFLFVIMLLRPDDEKSFFAENKQIKWTGIAIGTFLFAQLAYVIFVGVPKQSIVRNAQRSFEIGTIESIGRALFTQFLVPFEAIAFVLLASTIGALVLAKKKFD